MTPLLAEYLPLGRSVVLSDEPLLQEMQKNLRAERRFSVFFETVVLSPQFRRQRGRDFAAAAESVVRPQESGDAPAVKAHLMSVRVVVSEGESVAVALRRLKQRMQDGGVFDSAILALKNLTDHHGKESAIMFQTILVPLDGSVFAEHALPLAVSLGKYCGATLRLLRVVPPLADYLFMPPQLNDPLDKQLRELHRTEAQTYLDSVVHRLKDTGPIICDVVEEEEGISESICADVVKTKANLIVLTSHGRGALARFWLGSIADTLVRAAPVPVLLARPPEHPAAVELERPVTLKHLLLALGGNTSAELIIEPALAIGKCAKAEYTLVRVVRPAFPGWSGAHQIDEQNCQKAENYLRTVADRLRAEGATVHTRVHIDEQPANAILREAALAGADMIALETHGRGLSRLLIGSVADKVVRGSTIPVLVSRLPHQV